MKKPTSETTASPWTDQPLTESESAPTTPDTAQSAAQPTPGMTYDLEGLMTDFPTARELERFVYDETGIVLSLKGRANRVKYQVALDALTLGRVSDQYLGAENPYIDRSELVPEEPLQPAPPRAPGLPDPADLQNYFTTKLIPHPNAEARAQGRRVHCVFRKYLDNTITYEVLGPVEPRPHGERIDKFGRVRPEVIRWLDPRSGEQLAQRSDGTLTTQGRRLRALMQSMRVNNTNQWDVWVDRDFVENTEELIVNPWG